MGRVPLEHPRAASVARGTPGWRVALLTVGALSLFQAAVAAINLSPLMDYYTVDRLFDVNGEANLVAWFSSAVLLAIAAAAAVAAAADRASGMPRRLWLGWVLLAAFFVALSVDETAGLHELIGEKAHRFLDVGALPSLYTWVLVVAPIGLAAAALMIWWFAKTIGLTSAPGRLALAAITLWLAVPILEALDPSMGGPVALSVVEESLEVTGEALMLGAVFIYLATRGRLQALSRRFSAPEGSAG